MILRNKTRLAQRIGNKIVRPYRFIEVSKDTLFDKVYFEEVAVKPLGEKDKKEKTNKGE